MNEIIKIYSPGKQEKRETYWITIGLLLFIITALHLPIINRFFPIQEGWWQYYTMLMNSGKTMYRDFFVYMPPGFPVLVYILNFIGNNNFLFFRIYGLLERLLLIYCAYAILCKYFKPFHVFIALLSGVTLSISNFQDIIYSYYQSVLLLSILALYFFLHFYGHIQSGDIKKGNKYICLTGMLSGFVFIFKYPNGIMFLTVFFVMLSVLCLKLKAAKYGRSLICLIAGFVIPLLICTVVLVCTGTLMSLLSQTFGSLSAKGSVLRVLFGFLPEALNIYAVLGFLFPGSLILASIVLKSKITNIISGVLLTGSFLFVFNRFVRLALMPTVVLLLLISLTAIVLFYLLGKKKDMSVVIFLTVVCVVIIIINTLIPIGILQYINFNVSFFTAKNLFHFIVFIFMLCLSIGNFVAIIIGRSFIPTPVWILSVWSVTQQYAHGFSGTLEIHAGLLPIALCICVVLALDMLHSNLVKLGFCVLGLLCFSLVFIQKMAIPYYWWGWVESPVSRNEEYRVVDHEELAGFLLSRRTANMYEKICTLIEKNSPEGANLYSFPHVPIFNILTKRMSESTFSHVHYFDVCPDNIAVQDAIRLRKNPPDMIVLNNFDESDWRFHEAYFRGNKRSGQRDIKELIEKWVEEGTYKVIGQFENIFVYKREKQ
ncbi:MAG: hypothetical protein LBL56_03585 [Treponema sp.]|nr:hypothetical protein [Treponema sp.]